ncbi:MAG: hypothetical protein G01um101470_422 [Parcubacteria group bacterium Gr01-1014_70]|nr:MAG: hypothetical protein G01um101470_422 [Parcubacteria group bacterium Gr01-1014_70]
MRKTPFINSEYYHIYNRGTERRDIVLDVYDTNRFLQSMWEFNTTEPIGSIFENSFRNQSLGNRTPKSPLVEIVCYCVNLNHFHIIIKQISDNGISEFMKRLGGGYTNYFNKKYKRSGVLFQGKFKDRHIQTNEHLLYLSSYVNLNDMVHGLSRKSKHSLIRNSWADYVGHQTAINFCSKGIVLGQFATKKAYKKYALETLEYIKEKKLLYKELGLNLFED